MNEERMSVDNKNFTRAQALRNLKLWEECLQEILNEEFPGENLFIKTIEIEVGKENDPRWPGFLQVIDRHKGFQFKVSFSVPTLRKTPPEQIADILNSDESIKNLKTATTHSGVGY